MNIALIARFRLGRLALHHRNKSRKCF